MRYYVIFLGGGLVLMIMEVCLRSYFVNKGCVMPVGRHEGAINKLADCRIQLCLLPIKKPQLSSPFPPTPLQKKMYLNNNNNK